MAGTDANGRPIAGPADPEVRRRMLIQALRRGGDNRYQAPAPAVKPAGSPGGLNLRVEKALRDAGA